MRLIDFDTADPLLNWRDLGEAFRAGHRLPRAEISDTFLYRGKDTLLSRAAWIDGVGALTKTAMVFPNNPTQGLPMIHGGACLYSDTTGALDAVIDFDLVTKWKTAGDSVFAATMLARPESRKILILGAGVVSHNLRRAYGQIFPDARFKVWNRSSDKAEALAASFPDTEAVTDLADAVGWADIVSSATMSTDPILKGEWLRPGQHIDLIGAYRPDMREADDTAVRRARLFVDSRATTLDHIGELKIPLGTGVITPDDVIADYYDIPAGRYKRQSADEITLFKNGGGAHLDLMTAAYILKTCQTHDAVG